MSLHKPLEEHHHSVSIYYNLFSIITGIRFHILNYYISLGVLPPYRVGDCIYQHVDQQGKRDHRAGFSRYKILSLVKTVHIWNGKEYFFGSKLVLLHMLVAMETLFSL